MIEANIFQLNDFPISGDIRFDENSQTRKRFNGVRWQALCQVDNCSVTRAVNGLCKRHNNLTNKKKMNEEVLSKNYSNEKIITVNKQTSLKSRLSGELKTIVDGQTFLWEQHEREFLAQKRLQSNNDNNELSVKRKKVSSLSSSKIEDLIHRIDEKLIDMHKNVDMIINIRNSILSSL